ncbi:MAG: hypothetical protein KatS3mg029_0360 [Saprospiraceae bacterium]|nr:MAG: hypothetical protein KatS3mg029_0360 [Saprospiraceae bacterium]
MEKALQSYIRTVKELIQEDELEAAFKYLFQLDEKLGVGLQNDLVLQQARFKSNEKDQLRGLISAEAYQRTKAQIRYNLVTLADSIPRKLELEEMTKGVAGMDFLVQEEDAFQKVLGDRSHLVRIAWLEKAIEASKSVGRVVLPNGATGTGFLVADGYLFTNHHVLPDADVASESYVEFNFELDAMGRPKPRYRYRFDASDFLTNEILDCTRVKVLENGQVPLSEWGALELAPDAIPVVGDPVNIIQHPNGNDKQIAVTANKVISVWGPRIFYTADTEPGSSGSPVFNQDWRVVALHHAGKTEKEGGLQINERGDRAGANRGILFSEIVKWVGN